MHSIVRVLPQTAPFVYDLTTVEAVETELGLTANTSDDAILQTQITQASQIIASLCGRVFALQNVEEHFRGGFRSFHRESRLNLARYPVTEFSSLTIGGVEADASSYEVDETEGIVYRTSVLWPGWQGSWAQSAEIIATYTAGYDLPDDAPADLQRACTELVKTIRFNARRDPAVRDVQHGDTRVTYWVGARGGVNDVIPPTVTDLISSYKRYAV